MSAPRTLDEIVYAQAAAAGYTSTPLDVHIRAACIAYAAAETARLRAAGEALAKAMEDIASFDCATAGVGSPCSRTHPECESCIADAALAAWREALR